MDGSESAERERHLGAVQRNSLALREVPERYRADREIVLAAVQQYGLALDCAAEECKADREIVLEAVKQDSHALQYAAEECKADREIVLAAVNQRTAEWTVLHCADNSELRFAAEECKADREIVLAAVKQNPYALQYAADELLLDSTFAPEAKQDWYILKVSLLSGRSTVAALRGGFDNVEQILNQCCGHLGLDRTGNEKLVHGTEVVPAGAQVRSWPGLRPAGEVSEYQLVVGARKRTAAELHAP